MKGDLYDRGNKARGERLSVTQGRGQQERTRKEGGMGSGLFGRANKALAKAGVPRAKYGR